MNPLDPVNRTRSAGLAVGESSLPQNRIPAVLIAASAGGIRALSTIARALPADFPAAVLVVQHRTPTHKSMLVPILARSSSLPVEEAQPGHVMRAGTMYVAKPDLHLTVDPQGAFQYIDGPRIRHLLSSANPLFTSCAQSLGRRVIAVVLTGSGMDATDGVQDVKASGGTVIAQDEATSEHFGMPASAIQTGSVDYVVPLSGIAPMLVRLVASWQDRHQLT